MNRKGVSWMFELIEMSNLRFVNVLNVMGSQGRIGL